MASCQWETAMPMVCRLSFAAKYSLDLIELWVENQVMLELLPLNLMPEYLATVEPDSLSALLKNLAAAQ
jgi:hypothetical protein